MVSLDEFKQPRVKLREILYLNEVIIKMNRQTTRQQTLKMHLGK